MKIKAYPIFYQELVLLWSEVSEKEPVEISEICSEVLWNNKFIISKKESLFNKLFIDNGMTKILDIINGRGILLDWIEVQKKYSLNSSHILNWLGLIKCIPQIWKEKLKREYTELPNENNINKNVACISTKTAYQKLLIPLVIPPTSQKSLTKLLGLESVDWKKIYMLPRQVTIDSYLPLFQYKILNNILI